MPTQKPTKRQPHGYWKKHLVGWESSGLSPIEYCKIKNIHYKNFLAHKRRHCIKQSQKTEVHFVQANPHVPVKNSSGVLQLVLPNGIRMGVTPDLELAWIQKILSVVGAL